MALELAENQKLLAVPAVLDNMDFIRTNDHRTGRDAGGIVRQIVDVAIPAPYEGVGNALRRGLGTVRPDLPCDMVDLLRQLDRI